MRRKLRPEVHALDYLRSNCLPVPAIHTPIILHFGMVDLQKVQKSETGVTCPSCEGQPLFIGFSAGNAEKHRSYQCEDCGGGFDTSETIIARSRPYGKYRSLAAGEGRDGDEELVGAIPVDMADLHVSARSVHRVFACPDCCGKARVTGLRKRANGNVRYLNCEDCQGRFRTLEKVVCLSKVEDVLAGAA